MRVALLHCSLWRSIEFCLLSALIFTLGCKSADLQQVTDALGQYQAPLDQKTLVAGLKQALEVGTQNSVKQTSAEGGFSLNPRLKILTPAALSKPVKTLRTLGLGSLVDRFETQMNRAAEKASAEATGVFVDSIRQMSFSDAWGILKGPDDAATQFFRRTSEGRLRQKFQPVINQSMQKIGFYGDYQKMLNAYQSLPLSDKPDLNIENYIMQRTLDGLFVMVADEEAKIRHDPAARVTELLRRVFGN